MNVDVFKNLIKNVNELHFCRKYLFCPYIWFFDSYDGKDAPKGDYFSFKSTMAEIINENPNNIAIVGSAKYGFSMTPNAEKAFQAFSEKSDIDIVIISPSLFKEVWNAYREAYYNGYYWLIGTHARNIFRNFVIIHTEEREEYKSVYLRDIWLKMQELQKEAGIRHRIMRPIKFRIYASWDDAEDYHSSGVRRLKNTLENGE